MNKSKFFKIMEILKHANMAYAPELSKPFLRTWFSIFGNVDLMLFERVILQIVLREDKFPSVALVKRYLMAEYRQMKDRQRALENRRLTKPDSETVERIQIIVQNFLKGFQEKNKLMIGE